MQPGRLILGTIHCSAGSPGDARAPLRAGADPGFPAAARHPCHPARRAHGIGGRRRALDACGGRQRSAAAPSPAPPADGHRAEPGSPCRRRPAGAPGRGQAVDPPRRWALEHPDWPEFLANAERSHREALEAVVRHNNAFRHWLLSPAGQREVERIRRHRRFYRLQHGAVRPRRRRQLSPGTPCGGGDSARGKAAAGAGGPVASGVTAAAPGGSPAGLAMAASLSAQSRRPRGDGPDPGDASGSSGRCG